MNVKVSTSWPFTNIDYKPHIYPLNRNQNKLIF